MYVAAFAEGTCRRHRRTECASARRCFRLLKEGSVAFRNGLAGIATPPDPGKDTAQKSLTRGTCR